MITPPSASLDWQPLCACFCCSGSNLTPSAPWCRLRSRRSYFQAASCDVGYLTLSMMPWLCTNAWLAATAVVRDYYQMICLATFIGVALALQIFSLTRPAPAETGDRPALAG